ncbi:MAG: glutathione S-transferase family protein [Proteobacteria bacterium]|nr:glutathione S-transferase family protein [Pseudomonadota bacterium]
MKVYFAPLTGSFAVRCALYEAGATADFIPVDWATKTIPGGIALAEINPMAQVPTVILDDGTLLTEISAILLHIADTYPAAGLVPASRPARSQAERWLSFTAAELHASFFVMYFNPATPEGVRDFLRARLPRRLLTLDTHLGQHDYLADDLFSVADIYLYVAMNWVRLAGIDLANWPHLAAHHARIAERAAIKRAFAEERELYKLMRATA